MMFVNNFEGANCRKVVFLFGGILQKLILFFLKTII